MRNPSTSTVLAIATVAAGLVGCAEDVAGRGMSAGAGDGIDSLPAGSDGDSHGDSHGDGESGDHGAVFDVGDTGGADGAGACDVVEDEFSFSYIWIANTDEGTVSKIDTVLGIEDGRYATGPSYPSGSPSRTSVSQLGDAVVVNRFPGGITKIAATEDRCVDLDGDGTITTSSGPADVLPWGEDECVLWHTDIPDPPSREFGPRPVAWEGATLDPDTGCVAGQRLWVGFGRGDETAAVWRLDGSTGMVLDTVELDDWGAEAPYGGAVNADGDFWIIAETEMHAIRIDHETLSWEEHSENIAPYYGVAVDQNGDLWGAADGAVHYHVANDAWVVIATPNVGRLRGIAIDRDGRAWAAANDPCALVEIDASNDTLVDDQIQLPGCSNPVGVSIDVEGYVWVVDYDENRAYKVDPTTHAIALTVEGLVGPYTYSDMTGAGLDLVVNPPS